MCLKIPFHTLEENKISNFCTEKLFSMNFNILIYKKHYEVIYWEFHN